MAYSQEIKNSDLDSLTDACEKSLTFSDHDNLSQVNDSDTNMLSNVPPGPFVDYSQMPPLEKLNEDSYLNDNYSRLRRSPLLSGPSCDPLNTRINNRTAKQSKLNRQVLDSQPPELIPLGTGSLTPPMSEPPSWSVEDAFTPGELDEPSAFCPYKSSQLHSRSSRINQNSFHDPAKMVHPSIYPCDSIYYRTPISDREPQSLTQTPSLSRNYIEKLKTSEMERLKCMVLARELLKAESIPQLHYKEIPQVLNLGGIPKDKTGRKMSADTLLNPYIKHHQRNLPASCGSTNCSSSSCHEQFSSLDLPTRPMEAPWNIPQSPSISKTHRLHNSQSINLYQNCSYSSDDSERYLRMPIAEWTYADVIFFLMEACKEIRIDPEEVKIKKTDTGSVLLNMSPSDFETIVPNNGQQLYDYFVNFKIQHYVSSEGASFENLNNDPYSNQPGSNLNPWDNSHHHNTSYGDSSYSHHHSYPSYPSGPLHYQPEFSPGDYVPQGVQYTDHQSPFSPEEHKPFHHELPSAARKTFPPLHNYDDPVSDPDATDDEDKPPEPPKKRGPGRPPKPENERKRKAKKTGRLWEFIRNLLLDPKTCPSLVKWEDHNEGVFRIVQSDAIATKWGMRKNNEKMNYEKLSRAMRYYYKAKVFEPVWGKRLVYKFGSNAKGWRPLNPNNPNFLSPM